MVLQLLIEVISYLRVAPLRTVTLVTGVEQSIMAKISPFTGQFLRIISHMVGEQFKRMKEDF